MVKVFSKWLARQHNICTNLLLILCVVRPRKPTHYTICILTEKNTILVTFLKHMGEKGCEIKGVGCNDVDAITGFCN